jgi:hypothetical protein
MKEVVDRMALIHSSGASTKLYFKTLELLQNALHVL